jgi:hypothetical protein
MDEPLIVWADPEDPALGVESTPGLDAWRERYRNGDLTLADHRRLYERVAADYPNQNYYAAVPVHDFLAWSDAHSVIELGGWDGALAQEVLPCHPDVRRWDNYEIVQVPQACDLPAYRFHVPDVFVWELQELKADAFVASHVLEHLTASDLRRLIDTLDAEYAYVDVPLSETANDWKGTTTTHALELSIGEFDRAWKRNGWKVEAHGQRDGHVPSYLRWMRRY